jgi:hypothetical protein
MSKKRLLLPGKRETLWSTAPVETMKKYIVWIKVIGDSKWYSRSREYGTEDLAKAAASDFLGSAAARMVAACTTAPVGVDPNADH